MPALPEPDRFRSYLLVLARMRLHPMVQARIDASDVVQQTMLQAHEGREGFRGSTAGEMVAWLRRILATKMTDALRELRAGKRDIARERSLDAAVEQSSLRFERWLATEQSGPVERVERQEQAVQVAEALAALPEDQQDAVLLRHWQCLPLAQIATHMERSEASVAGLLRRGLDALRQRFPAEERP